MAFVTGEIFGGRAAAQFDAVGTTVFATVTGLSFNVEAGKTYIIRGVFHCTLDAVGAGKFQLAGTATVTNLVTQFISWDNGAVAGITSARSAALATAFNITAGPTDVFVIMEATLTVNAAGTLLLQFAQLVAAGTSSVLRGSQMQLLVVT